ncbi:DUF3900 domain-containing protein [Bacillus sp. FJAT-45350]|uniref:DUF3900 domain-containing protein n=1 Tax=Bacillus sp. FJAT-45350 TaxID=2011014 RepID=UPI000BB9265F|nr:DUF3900 domain-containing protein [Bacillus sp. FJAT-45350]
MDFIVKYISFFVVQDEQEEKVYKHYQTLDETGYDASELKTFLDGELMRITNRKVERHPKSDQVPTKIGRFVVEEGYDLGSNPNYNLFKRIRNADTKDDYTTASNQLVRTYLDASAVRGGVLLIAQAKLNKYFDEPFVFVIKCDFEQKIASITNEMTLIRQVETAISAKNMKSIMYPYMPEEGMLETWELKVHQASHARYFEDFLKYVEYEKTITNIVSTQVVEMASQYIAETYQEESEERGKEESALEAWATSPQREIQEKWTQEQVVEASAHLVEQMPELELKMKLDNIQIKALLSDFGDSVHIAKVNGKYILLIEGDGIEFGSGHSPVEMLKPGELHEVIEKIGRRG